MAYEEFKGAIDKAGATKAPKSPYADIAGLFNSQFALGAGAGPTAGLIGTARVDYANAQAAAAAARDAAQRKEAAKNEEIKQKYKDYSNPEKWRQVSKADGGYDFYDPLGKKVTVAQFAEVKGQQPYQVLKDSDNSTDQQFIREYNALKAFSSARNPEEQLKAIINHPSLLEATGAVGEDVGVFKGKLQESTTKEGKDKTKAEQKLAESAMRYLGQFKPEDVWKKFIEYYTPFFDPESTEYPMPRPEVAPVAAPSPSLKDRAKGIINWLGS